MGIINPPLSKTRTNSRLIEKLHAKGTAERSICIWAMLLEWSQQYLKILTSICSGWGMHERPSGAFDIAGSWKVLNKHLKHYVLHTLGCIKQACQANRVAKTHYWTTGAGSTQCKKRKVHFAVVRDYLKFRRWWWSRGVCSDHYKICEKEYSLFALNSSVSYRSLSCIVTVTVIEGGPCHFMCTPLEGHITYL